MEVVVNVQDSDSIAIRPRFKEGSQGFPLDTQSCHSSRVHGSWIFAEASRLCSLGSSTEARRDAITRFIARLRFHMYDAKMVLELERRFCNWCNPSWIERPVRSPKKSLEGLSSVLRTLRCRELWLPFLNHFF